MKDGNATRARADLAKRLYGYLKPYRPRFCATMLLMVGFGATDGAVPFLVKYVLDGVFTPQSGSTRMLYLLVAALLAFALIRAVLDFAQQFYMAQIGHWIVRDIRRDVNNHLLKLPPDFYAFRSTADLVSRVTSDVILVRTLLTDAVSAIIRDSIRVVALLGAAIYLDPFLAIIAAVVFPIGIFPVYRFGRKMRKLSRVGQESISALSGVMQESCLGNRVVKVFGQEEFERKRFAVENEKLTRTFVKAERVRALVGPVNEVLATAAIAGLVMYGGYSVMTGLRSQGGFIAFLMSVFLLYDPFKKLSRISSTVHQGLAGGERIVEILHADINVADPASPCPLASGSDIEFSKVAYAYAGAEEGQGPSLALRGIDLKIEEGSKIAIVGFSGSGKSTLVDLIPRFMDPTEGRVLIGGVDVSTVRLADLRARIAMVGQHTFLFHDTIFRNIQYGNPLASPEEVYEAARAAYAYDFIDALPQGFETVLGEAGMTLSGGERQRVAIARALLKNAPILILDEATASLDSRSETEVQGALEVLEKGRTTIIIAHRLSTVRNADMVVVLREGEIVERGSYQGLLAKGGEFAKLYALQFREDKGGESESQAAEALV